MERARSRRAGCKLRLDVDQFSTVCFRQLYMAMKFWGCYPEHYHDNKNGARWKQKQGDVLYSATESKGERGGGGVAEIPVLCPPRTCAQAGITGLC
jgi:hypothetical protein